MSDKRELDQLTEQSVYQFLPFDDEIMEELLVTIVRSGGEEGITQDDLTQVATDLVVPAMRLHFGNMILNMVLFGCLTVNRKGEVFLSKDHPTYRNVSEKQQLLLDQVEIARQLWQQGVHSRVIAERIGRSPATPLIWAKRYGWGRAAPEAESNNSPTAPMPDPGEEEQSDEEPVVEDGVEVSIRTVAQELPGAVHVVRTPARIPRATLKIAEQRWKNGDAPFRIAFDLGHTVASVQGWADQYGWGLQPEATIEPEETPKRRCDGCAAIVDVTPCPHCGQEWRRTA